MIRKIGCFLFSSFFLINFVHAETGITQEGIAEANEWHKYEQPNRFHFALGYTYAQAGNKIINSKTYGNLWMWGMGYDGWKPWNIYYGFDSHFDGGRVGGSGLNGYSHDWWLKGRLGYSFAFGVFDEFQLALYSGLGYFTHTISYSKSPIDYHMRMWWIEVPIGFRFRIRIIPQLRVELYSQYGFMLDPHYKVKRLPGVTYKWRKAATRGTFQIDLPIIYSFDIFSTSLLDVALVASFRDFGFNRRTDSSVRSPKAVYDFLSVEGQVGFEF